MKPYCWSHPMSTLTTDDYHMKYPCNYAYVKAKNLTYPYTNATTNRRHDALFYLHLRMPGHPWDNKTQYSVSCVFITELGRRLGFSDPYEGIQI